MKSGKADEAHQDRAGARARVVRSVAARRSSPSSTRAGTWPSWRCASRSCWCGSSRTTTRTSSRSASCGGKRATRSARSSSGGASSMRGAAATAARWRRWRGWPRSTSSTTWCPKRSTSIRRRPSWRPTTSRCKRGSAPRSSGCIATARPRTCGRRCSSARRQKHDRPAQLEARQRIIVIAQRTGRLGIIAGQYRDRSCAQRAAGRGGGGGLHALWPPTRW